VCVKRSKLLPDGGGVPHLEPLKAQLRAAVEHAKTVGEMRRDAEAKELWHRVYEQLSTGLPGMLGAMTGRAEAQVMRLACLYALGELSSQVRRHHLEAALELWRYCFESARYIFGHSLGDPTADEILRALQNAPDGLLKSDIFRIFKNNKSSSDIGRALAVLEECHLARRMLDSETGGRAAERWLYQAPSITNNEFDERSPLGPPFFR
jgi:hypothetical protein